MKQIVTRTLLLNILTLVSWTFCCTIWCTD